MSAELELPPGVTLCDVPAGVNPDDPNALPNFDDPVSLQNITIAIAAICLFFASITLGGRLWVNKRNLKAADWMMAIGFVFDVAVVGIILSISHYYRHAWDTPLCWLNVRYQQITCSEVLLVGIALFFPKASIFLFYLQLFSVDKFVRWGSYIGLIFAFLAYVPSSLSLAYFNAPHIGETWEELLLSGRAADGIPGGVAIGAFSVLIDVYIFVLPLPALFKLKLPMRKRLQLVGLFATATIGIVASVVCCVYRVRLLGLKDTTWEAGSVAIAIIVENNVAVVVGSLPAFAHFMRVYVSDSFILKSLRSRLSTTKTSNYESTTAKSATQQSRDVMWTFGTGPPRERQQRGSVYYELNEGPALRMSTKDDAAPADMSHLASPHSPPYVPDATHASQGGIVRTVGFDRRDEYDEQQRKDLQREQYSNSYYIQPDFDFGEGQSQDPSRMSK